MLTASGVPSRARAVRCSSEEFIARQSISPDGLRQSGILAVVPRFFVPATHVTGDRCFVGPPDARHIALSLRMRVGELLSVADDSGTEHEVRVEHVERDRVEGLVVTSRPVQSEPRLRVHMVQALPRRGMDDAVEAMSQAGAAAIWPVVSDRSVARPDATRIAQRTDRWRSIAREAAGLAYRGAPPEIAGLGDLSTTLAALPPDTRILVCTVGGAATPLTTIDIDTGRPTALCDGPEGGWSAADLATLAAAGAEPVHLGPRVYRSCLAGAFACTVLLARAGDCGAAPSAVSGAEA
jgi:16S rRNA (uracil1498-N3)-methyltransferase